MVLTKQAEKAFGEEEFLLVPHLDLTFPPIICLSYYLLLKALLCYLLFQILRKYILLSYIKSTSKNKLILAILVKLESLSNLCQVDLPSIATESHLCGVIYSKDKTFLQ